MCVETRMLGSFRFEVQHFFRKRMVLSANAVFGNCLLGRFDDLSAFVPQLRLLPANCSSATSAVARLIAACWLEQTCHRVHLLEQLRSGCRRLQEARPWTGRRYRLYPIQILRANNAAFMNRAALNSPITPIKSHFARSPTSAITTNRGNEMRLNLLIDTKPAEPPLSVRYGSNNTPVAKGAQEERSRNQPVTIRTMNNKVSQLSRPHGFQSSRIIRVKGSSLSAATSLAPSVDPRWKPTCPSENTNGSPKTYQR